MVNLKAILISIIIMITLMTGCITARTSDPVPALQIKAHPQYYTLTMSSVPGIGLTPAYSPGIDNKTMSFRWQTDNGHFLSWSNSTVRDLGSDVTTDDTTVYWSYKPGDIGSDKPIAHVCLELIDSASGHVIDTATLHIGWEDPYGVKVLNST
ncbi:hypothetical protein [Methanocella sp. MCL-LM]|uniref:hypothetical protein n=1 Tax=Methanocella sp. MCL-LM TaxID=3412035 RepID=UPI003C72B728